jgi:hypothetical protein
VKANGLVSLAHQLIAAKLNVASGAAPIAATIAAADALIAEGGTGTVPPIGSGFLSPSASAPLLRLLEDYNEGVTPPGACLER